ncbi:MAG: hypothetical protein ACK2U2_21420, partial [Anaerolineae bacterium]
EKFYPKALRRKFAWVKHEDEYAIPDYDEDGEGDEEGSEGAEVARSTPEPLDTEEQGDLVQEETQAASEEATVSMEQA